MSWPHYLGIIVIFFLILTLYIRYKKKKYTRERYAFFATGLIFTYSLTVVSHFLTDISLLKILFLLYNNLPLDNIPISDSSWTDKLWSFFILSILCMFVFLIFENWHEDGKISKKDNMMRDINEDLSFLQAAFIGMKLSKIDTIDLDKNEKSLLNKSEFELTFLDQPRDWASEVRDLLQMYSIQYSVNKNEWYNEHNCFFSSYMNQPLLVICSIKTPEDDYIESKIKIFQKISNSDNFKVIVAIKEGLNIEKNKLLKDNYIEFLTKEFLLKNLINFNEYNTYLSQQFYKDEISEGEPTSLSDIYVKSDGIITTLRENENHDLAIENVEDYLINWAKKSNNEEQIALLGDYGQGKSVLSLKFANELINSKFKRQPIIIELRGKSPRNMPMIELVAAWACRFNYNVNAILTLLKEGRLVIILEGFDELDMVGDKLRRLEHFKTLWEFARYKKSKVIITGRPNLFLNNDEARNYLQLSCGKITTFHVKAIKLEPFSREKIKLALRNTSPIISEEIINQYDSSLNGKGFSDLISRPSTLFQTSIIWNSINKSNLNSSKVINSFIDHAYKRQAQKLLAINGTNLESPVLTQKERSYFMLGIAVGMVQKGGYSNYISGKELIEVVNRLYRNIPELCSDDHHSSSLDLKKRLGEEGFDSVYNDVRTAGIIVRDLTSNDSFKFAHKSFLESLFSTFIKNRISPIDKYELLISNTIIKSLSIKDIYSLSFSEEVIQHITENITNQDKDFGDQEALSLIKSLSKNAMTIDFLFYRRRIYFSILSWFQLLSISIIVFLILNDSLNFLYLGSYKDTINKSIGPPILAILLFLEIIKDSLIKKIRPAILIWKKSCEVNKYNWESGRVLSEKIVTESYYSNAFKKFEKYISKAYKTINKN